MTIGRSYNLGNDYPSDTCGGIYVFELIEPYSYVTIGGRAYRTVTIGNQEWLAENLDYKWDGLVIGADGTSDEETRANYYNNDEATYGVNGNKYGLLYNWPAVKYLEDNKATLLPEGWHVPSRDEWDALIDDLGGIFVAGKKLASKTGWTRNNGTDDYGFTLYPAGFKYIKFNNLGSLACVWSSTEFDKNKSYYYFFIGTRVSRMTESIVNRLFN